MYQIHPIADIFPRMPESELAALAEDIGDNGLLEAIWLYEGKILDGRHRYRACEISGVEPEFRQYEGDDPLGFVVSLNLKRRHLSESQRAMVASELANMPNGGWRGNQWQSANLQSATPQVSQSTAADLLQVSPRSVATAAKINREAPEEVLEAVKSGEVSINLASQFISLPEEEKESAKHAIEEGGATVKEAIKEAVKRAHVANNSGNNEWYTPSDYIELARRVMGAIDTDPATSLIANKRIMAETIYTAEDNGLTKVWRGRVWMNPPYATPLISMFSEAVSAKYEDGEIEQACVLVNNATETAWFQRMLKAADAVCFPKGRIRFIDPDGNVSSFSPLQGQAVIYFGSNTGAFVTEFSKKGVVLRHG